MAIRILIADDHSVVRQAIALMLSGHSDFEIVGQARDGQDAIEQVHSAMPDVVLMDINMPRLNGLEATEWIHATHPKIRVIGLSMHHDPEMIQKMRDSGAVSFVTKSAPPEELIAAIRAAG